MVARGCKDHVAPYQSPSHVNNRGLEGDKIEGKNKQRNVCYVLILK